MKMETKQPHHPDFHVETRPFIFIFIFILSCYSHNFPQSFAIKMTTKNL